MTEQRLFNTDFLLRGTSQTFCSWNIRQHFTTGLEGHLKQQNHQEKAPEWEKVDRLWKGYLFIVWEPETRKQSSTYLDLSWDDAHGAIQICHHSAHVGEYWFGDYKYILVSRQFTNTNSWRMRIECILKRWLWGINLDSRNEGIHLPHSELGKTLNKQQYVFNKVSLKQGYVLISWRSVIRDSEPNFVFPQEQWFSIH